MRIALGPVFAGIAFLTLTACTSVPSVSEIPASIANATTAADHQKIADYFAQKAARYDAEAALHEKMARSYASRPRGDVAVMQNHCRSLQGQFTNAAKDARALEQAHRQMAGSSGQ